MRREFSSHSRSRRTALLSSRTDCGAAQRILHVVFRLMVDEPIQRRNRDRGLAQRLAPWFTPRFNAWTGSRRQIRSKSFCLSAALPWIFLL